MWDPVKVICDPPQYLPVGECVYCGARTYAQDSNRPLADEHVVPFALGGSMILPEANCRKCERITGRFEQFALKGAFHLPRLYMGIKSRRKKPATLPLYTEKETGFLSSEEVPVDLSPFFHPSIARVLA
jgi:hypothetical protein